MRVIVVSLAALLCLAACGTENKAVDPTLLKGTFRGITYTNPYAQVVGPVDRDDWRLSTTTQPPFVNFVSPKPVEIIPDGFLVHPAYPNPFNGSLVAARLTLAARSIVIVEIVGPDGLTVHNEAGVYDAGYCEIPWTDRDGAGNKRPDGVYRVYYYIKIDDAPVSDDNVGFTGYGDIWLTHSKTMWWTDDGIY